jgi:hypothetical protein
VLLGHGPAVRDLARVDDLHVVAQLVEQGAGRQPVGEDHVGLGEQLPPAHGDQAGVAGPAADDRDPGRVTAAVAGTEPAGLEAGDDRVADRGAVPGVAPLRVDTEHGDAGTGRLTAGRRPGGRRPGVVGADIPGPLCLSGRSHGGIHLGVVRAGADQPGPGAVAGPVAPRLPADPPGRGQVFQRRGDLRRYQQHVGARVEQGGDPPGRDRSPAHDDDAAALQAEPQQVRVHGSFD